MKTLYLTLLHIFCEIMKPNIFLVSVKNTRNMSQEWIQFICNLKTAMQVLSILLGVLGKAKKSKVLAQEFGALAEWKY